jgi:hypothetical protein
VEDRNTPLVLPKPEPVGSEFGGPESMEAKCGSEQDEAIHFRMAGSIQSGQIAAEARADDDGWFAAAKAFDESELFGEGQAFEIALGQIWNFDCKSESGEFFREEAGLAGSGARRKTMKIKDTQRMGQHLHLKLRGSNCYSRRLRAKLRSPRTMM